MISQKAKYGIRAVIYIAQQSLNNRRIGGKEIAEAVGSPEHFTAKILQDLVRAKLINSIKGPNGGFEMDQEQRLNTNIKDLVEVLDGDELYTSCGLGLEFCSDGKPCPIHDSYKKFKNLLIDAHTKQSIEELSLLVNENHHLKT